MSIINGKATPLGERGFAHLEERAILAKQFLSTATTKPTTMPVTKPTTPAPFVPGNHPDLTLKVYENDVNCVMVKGQISFTLPYPKADVSLFSKKVCFVQHVLSNDL